jgi:hypothetical protein
MPLSRIFIFKKVKKLYFGTVPCKEEDRRGILQGAAALCRRRAQSAPHSGSAAAGAHYR